MRAWPSQFLRSFQSDETQPLQVRLYRLVCLTAAVTCLGVILPINLVQNLPLGVHLGNVLLGASAVWCFRASRGGRHYFSGFFLLLLLVVNLLFFLNGGANGS